MKIPNDSHLTEICCLIRDESLSIAEWRDIESDDMFQKGHFCGGFEAIEDEFCFSYYSPDGQEYWFQLSLEECLNLAKGDPVAIDGRPAEV